MMEFQDSGEYNQIEEFHNLSRELLVELNLQMNSYLEILSDEVYLHSAEGQAMTHTRLLD